MRMGIVALLLAVAGARAEEKPQYEDLANLIHKALLAKVPREHEFFTDWGTTTPVTDDIRLRRARRTLVKVGDRMEWPHGPWKRTKLWLEDPSINIGIRVTELRSGGKDTTRLGLEVTVALRGERQRQGWVKGLKLLDLTVQADAVIVANIDTDLTISLDTRQFPPAVNVAPKVLGTKLELRRFDLNRVGPVLLGQQEARELGEDLRGALQDLMKQYEGEATVKLNEAITKGLKEGKTTLTPATLLKLNLPTSEKK